MATLVERDYIGIDWPKAIVAGVVAMIVFAVVEMAFSWAMRGQSPWQPLAIFGGVTIDALLPGQHAGGGPRTIAVGAALLVALGALSGVILAYIVDRIGAFAAAIAGGVFGLAMFAIDLYALAWIFPELAAIRDWMSGLAYAIQGALTAGLYKAVTRQARPVPAAPGRDLRDLRHAPLL